MEYYSTVKKKTILPFEIACTDMENIMLSEISQARKKNKKQNQLVWLSRLSAGPGNWVVGWIPIKGLERGNHTFMFLSLSLSLLLSLKMKKKNLKKNKPCRERQIPYDFIHMWNLMNKLN